MEYKDEVYNIVGAAFTVYNTLGPGFLESVYQEALEIELQEESIPYTAESQIKIYYKDRPLQKEFFADFVCYSHVIVEVKALDHMASKEEAQLLNYLKATQCPVGVLVNFGHQEKLQWKRFVR